MTDYHENFMHKMRFYRKRAGMTQAQLAEYCNVSNGTIGNIECGITKPSFDLILIIAKNLDIIKIADILKISPAEFFKTEIDAHYQDDYITSGQFEILSDAVHSAVNNALNTTFRDLKETQFRIEHD